MSVTETIPAEAPSEQRSSWARVPAAFRLQFTVPSLLVQVPLMVFVFAWVVAYGIGLTIVNTADDLAGEPIYVSGAAQAPLWTLAFMAAYAASHTFPFSLALSFSRRVFVIGAFLAFGAVSVVFGVLVVLGTLLERATGGMGIDTYLYNVPFLIEGPGNGIALLGVAAALLCQAVMLLGFGSVIVYLRVGLARLWALIIGLVIVLAGSGMLITVNGGWGSVWQWLVELNLVKISGWLLLVVVVQTVVIYLVIRRTSPRN